jgi:hypothetical protein
MASFHECLPDTGEAEQNPIDTAVEFLELVKMGVDCGQI